MFSTFSTQKRVVLEDKLLGRLHVVFQGVALFYIACQIIYFRQYAQPEVPNGQVNTWSLAGNSYQAAVPPNITYCTPEALKAMTVTGVGFVEPSCAFGQHELIHSIGKNTIFVATYSHAQEVVNGSTVVRMKDTVFKGSEYVPFSFLHGVSLSWMEQSQIETELVGKDGKVFMRSATGVVQNIRFKDFLDLAGVDLDGESAQDPSLSSGLGRVVHRVTGVQLVARLEYRNLYEYLPGFDDIRCRITVQKLPYLWGFAGPSAPAYISYPDHYWSSSLVGINLTFVIQGQVHHFSWISLVTGVISGVVLIKLADSAIVTLARLMYRGTYADAVQEKVSLARAAVVLHKWRRSTSGLAKAAPVHPAPPPAAAASDRAAKAAAPPAAAEAEVAWTQLPDEPLIYSLEKGPAPAPVSGEAPPPATDIRSRAGHVLTPVEAADLA